MQISAYAAARNYPLHNIAPQGVDQNKVDMALRNIRADIPLNESQLANALRNPNLSQEEKDLIVETLASLYRIPMYLPYGALMLLLIFMTYRVAGRDKAGRVMAVVMGVGLLG